MTDILKVIGIILLLLFAVTIFKVIGFSIAFGWKYVLIGVITVFFIIGLTTK